MSKGTQKTARLSLCKGYRWRLGRTWDVGRPVIHFIGLNPSTADAETDDRTIVKMMGFATRWGFGGIVVTNLFSVRTKDPRVMKAHDNPIGLATDAHIKRAASESQVTVCAWGVRGAHLNRESIVYAKLWRYHHRLRCFGYTKAGHPLHPLYQKNTTKLKLYTHPQGKR